MALVGAPQGNQAGNGKGGASHPRWGISRVTISTHLAVGAKTPTPAHGPAFLPARPFRCLEKQQEGALHQESGGQGPSPAPCPLAPVSLWVQRSGQQEGSPSMQPNGSPAHPSALSRSHFSPSGSSPDTPELVL